MTKQEFVDQVADRAGLSKKDAAGCGRRFPGHGRGRAQARERRVLLGLRQVQRLASLRSRGSQSRDGRADPDRGVERSEVHRRGRTEEGGQVAPSSSRVEAGCCGRERDAVTVASIEGASTSHEGRTQPLASAIGWPSGSPSASRSSCSGSIPIRRGCGHRRSTPPSDDGAARTRLGFAGHARRARGRRALRAGASRRPPSIASRSSCRSPASSGSARPAGRRWPRPSRWRATTACS